MMYIEVYRFVRKNIMIRIAVVGGDLFIITNDSFTKEAVVANLPLNEVESFVKALHDGVRVSEQEHEAYQNLTKLV